MPSRPRRLSLALPILILLAWVTGLTPASVGAAQTYSRDLYFRAGYEPQIDGRTCVPASTAMMMNFIARRDLRLNQMSILRYAQPRDALNNAVQRGTDPLGWSVAASYYSRYTSRPTTYMWEAYTSRSSALKAAATRIARTGKPVGLLVQHGRHAIVMTGFIAEGNPADDDDFRLTHVLTSDPLRYSHRHIRYVAGDTPLDRYLELDATTRYDRAWYRKYVIVAPQN